MTLGQRDICQSDVSGSAAAMSLTARQAEVLQLAGRGLCGKQIAHHLGISVRTVEDHFSAMRQRTGTHSQTELIACATAAGLVRPAFLFPEPVNSGTRGRLDPAAADVPAPAPPGGAPAPDPGGKVHTVPGKQGTRMIKLTAACCGYTVRTTRKWVEQGYPLCPHGQPMHED